MFGSGTSPVRRSGVGLVVALCVSVVLVSPALAFNTTATRRVTTVQFRAASVTATCPHGEHVQFAGFEGQWTGPESGLNAMVLPTALRIRGSSDRVTVDGRNISAPAATGAAHLTATAYCFRGVARTKFTATAVIRRSGHAIATCPTGQVVLGAGFWSPAGIARAHDISRIERIGTNRLQVSLVNTVYHGSSSLTAIAYCGAGPAPVLVAKSVTIAKRHEGAVSAKCPTGKSLTFGGVAADARITAKTHPFIYPLRVFAANTRVWRVSGWNVGTAGGKLTALAYCR